MLHCCKLNAKELGPTAPKLVFCNTIKHQELHFPLFKKGQCWVFRQLTFKGRCYGKETFLVLSVVKLVETVQSVPLWTSLYNTIWKCAKDTLKLGNIVQYNGKGKAEI